VNPTLHHRLDCGVLWCGVVWKVAVSLHVLASYAAALAVMLLSLDRFRCFLGRPEGGLVASHPSPQPCFYIPLAGLSIPFCLLSSAWIAYAKSIYFASDV